MLPDLGQPIGVLLESSLNKLAVRSQNTATDINIGDLFYIESRRGLVDEDFPRYFLFRVAEYEYKLRLTKQNSDGVSITGHHSRAHLVMLGEEEILELYGNWLGYAQWQEHEWQFYRPRKIPELSAPLYQVTEKNAHFLAELLGPQLQGELYLGDLLVGGNPIEQLPVCLPIAAIPTHIGVWGGMGSDKTNLMLVLIRSFLEHNRAILQSERQGQKVSLLAIGSQSGFVTKQGGVEELLAQYESKYGIRLVERLVGAFYYLALKETPHKYAEVVRLSAGDITPADMASVMDVGETQLSLMWALSQQYADCWIGRLYSLGEAITEAIGKGFGSQTIHEVMRQVEGFYRSRLFCPYDPENPLVPTQYTSSLLNILEALENGRVLILDDRLLGEMDQCLATTVIARTLLALRRAVKVSVTAEDLRQTILENLGIRCSESLGGEERQGGMQEFARQVWEAVKEGRVPYLDGDRVRNLEELTVICITVEKTSRLLSSRRMQHNSISQDVLQEGHQLGVGLLVASQRITEIDEVILKQINTQLVMPLKNEQEINAVLKNTSTDLSSFTRELALLSRRQGVLTTRHRRFAVTLMVPMFTFSNSS